MDTADFCKPMSLTTLTTPVDSFDYNMNHYYRGICLILENEKFSPQHNITRNLVPRTGSNVDSESLENLFNKLNFDVIVRQNLPSNGIKQTLQQIANLDHSNNDCFVCIVLTHGDLGSLYSYDGRYPIDQLFNHFRGDRCPTLVGKPKLFFIQACQGSRFDSGVLVSTDALDAAHYFKIPTYADFMIAYSTLPGFYSFRNTEKGAWFIRALVEVLHDYHHQFDLLSMMTIVCHKISYYFSSNAANPEQTGMKQVPCITSMLTRRVFFTPKSSTTLHRV